MIKTIIGIDPAFRAGGFAMCQIDCYKRVTFYSFSTVLEAIMHLLKISDMFCSLIKEKDTVFVVENSNLQSVTFNMKSSKPVLARQSRNVGANQAVSQIVCDIIENKFGSHSLIEVSPKQKGAKWKDDRIVFKLADSLGLKIRESKLNQDKRDAFKLAVTQCTKKNGY